MWAHTVLCGVACSRPVYRIQSGHRSPRELHLSPRHATVCVTRAARVSFGVSVSEVSGPGAQEMGGTRRPWHNKTWLTERGGKRNRCRRFHLGYVRPLHPTSSVVTNNDFMNERNSWRDVCLKVPTAASTGSSNVCPWHSKRTRGWIQPLSKCPPLVIGEYCGFPGMFDLTAKQEQLTDPAEAGITTTVYSVQVTAGPPRSGVGSRWTSALRQPEELERYRWITTVYFKSIHITDHVEENTENMEKHRMLRIKQETLVHIPQLNSNKLFLLHFKSIKWSSKYLGVKTIDWVSPLRFGCRGRLW